MQAIVSERLRALASQQERLRQRKPETQKEKAKQEKECQSLEQQVKALKLYQQFQVGDWVISNPVEQPHLKKPGISSLLDCNHGQLTGFDMSDSLRVGQVVEMNLSPGGMPQVWVSWYGAVEIPEQPERLTLIKPPAYALAEKPQLPQDAPTIASLFTGGGLFEVRSLVRPNSPRDNLKGLEVEIVQGDLNGPNLSEQMRGCQVLFHVAAHYSLWQGDRDALYRNNVLGTRHVLAAARQAGVERTVYTSSVAAIGVGKPGQLVDETHQSPVEKLVGHYKKSKFFAEQEAFLAAQAGQDVVIVNPSTPIGPLDIKPTPTGEIILRFLQRKMPAYVDTGLNFIDVRDVVRGHLLALEKGKAGDRYLLGHRNLSLKALLDELAEITGLPAPQQAVPLWLPLSIAWIDECILARLGKTPSVPLDGVRMSKQPMYYDASKAVKELGLPQSPIRTALKDAIDWFVRKGYV